MVDDSDDYEEPKSKKKTEVFMGMDWGQIGAVAGGTALVGLLALGFHVLRPTFDQMTQQQNQQRMMLAQQQQQQAQIQQQQAALAQQQMAAQGQPQMDGQPQTEELNLSPEPERAPQAQRRRVKEVEDEPIPRHGDVIPSV